MKRKATEPEMEGDKEGMWKCTKCENVVYSKCVRHRSIFSVESSNDLTLLRLTTSLSWKNEDKTSLIIKIDLGPDEEKEKIDTAMRILKILIQDDVTFKELLCDHDYVTLTEEPFVCCLGHIHLNPKKHIVPKLELVPVDEKPKTELITITFTPESMTESIELIEQRLKRIDNEMLNRKLSSDFFGLTTALSDMNADKKTT